MAITEKQIRALRIFASEIAHKENALQRASNLLASDGYDVRDAINLLHDVPDYKDELRALLRKVLLEFTLSKREKLQELSLLNILADIEKM